MCVCAIAQESILSILHLNTIHDKTEERIENKKVVKSLQQSHTAHFHIHEGTFMSN